VETGDFVVKRGSRQPQTYKADLIASDTCSGINGLFMTIPDLKPLWLKINEEFASTQAHHLKEPCESCSLLLEERLDFFERLYARSASFGSQIPFNLVQVALFTLDDIVTDLLYSRGASFGSRIPALTVLLNFLQWFALQDSSTLLLSHDFAQLMNQFFSYLYSVDQAHGLTTLPELMFHFLQTNYAVGELYVRHLLDMPDVAYFFVHNCLVVYKLLTTSAPGDFFYELMPLHIEGFAMKTLTQCSCLICVREGVNDFLGLIVHQILKLLHNLPGKLDAFSLSDFTAVFQLTMKHMQSSAHALYSALSLIELIKVMSSKTIIHVRKLVPHLKELLYLTLLTYIKTTPGVFSKSFHSDEEPLGLFFVVLEEVVTKHFVSEQLNLIVILEVLNMPDITSQGRETVPVVQCYALELLVNYLDKTSDSMNLMSLVNYGLCDVLVSPYVFSLNCNSSVPEVTRLVEWGIERTHRVLLKTMGLGLEATSRLMNCLHTNIEHCCLDTAYLVRTRTLLEFLTVDAPSLPGVPYATSNDSAYLYFYDLYMHILSILDRILPEASQLLLRVYFDIIRVLLESRAFTEQVSLSAEVLSKLLRNEATFDLTIANLATGFKQTCGKSLLFPDFLTLLRTTENPGQILKMVRFASEIVRCAPKDSKYLKPVQEQLVKEVPSIVIYKLSTVHELSICSALLELLLDKHSGFGSELSLIMEDLFTCIENIVEGGHFSDAEYRALITRTIKSFESSSSAFFTQLFRLVEPAHSPNGTLMILSELQGLTAGSLYNIHALANCLSQLQLCYDYPETKDQALRLTADIGHCYLSPANLTRFLKKCNERVNARDIPGIHQLVSCLRQMTDDNHPFMNTMVPGYECKRKLPRFTYNFRSATSSLRVSNFGQTFINDALSLMFWIRPTKPGHILALYTETPQNRLGCYIDPRCTLVVYVKTHDTQRTLYATQLQLSLQSWSFVALNIVKRSLVVVVDSTVLKSLILPKQLANYFKKSKSAHLNFGRKKSNSLIDVPAHSFVGDLTHFYFIPGAKELPLCVFRAGFSSFMEGRARETVNTVDYEDLTDEQLNYAEAVANKLSLKLHCSAEGESPMLVSLKMQQLRRQEIEAVIDIGKNSSEMETVSRNVTVCSGHSVLESFHVLGGLKLFVVLLSKLRGLKAEISPTDRDYSLSTEEEGATNGVRRSAELSAVVNEVLMTLTSLMKERSKQTLHEVFHEHFLDVLGAELQLLEKHDMLDTQALSCITELCRQSWLFKLPDNYADEVLCNSFIESHPLHRLVTNFNTWQKVDLRTFYEEVSSLGALKPTEGSKLSYLKLQVLHYYMNLSRTDPELLEKMLDLDPDFLAKLRLHLRVYDIVSMIDYLIATHNLNAIGAFQLVLRIIESFKEADLIRQLKRDEGRFKSMMKSLARIVENIAASSQEKGWKYVLYRVLGSTLTKCFTLRIKVFSTYLQKIDDRYMLEEMGNAVFKVACQLDKQDMLGLLCNYHRSCCRYLKTRPNFYGVLNCLRTLSFEKKDFPEEYVCVAELIAEQFIEVSDPRDWNSMYFAFLSLCMSFKATAELQHSFATYILGVLEEMLAHPLLNEVMLSFILYLAEDLQLNLKVAYSRQLLSKLVLVTAKLGLLHCNDAKLPEFARWELLRDKLDERDSMLSHSRREGGFIRILLNLLLKSLASGSQVDFMVEMLRMVLDQRSPPQPVKFNFRKVAALAELKGSLIRKDKRYEGESDLFEDELNILAYVIAELGELLRCECSLQVHSVYRLFLDLIFCKNRSDLSFVDLYLKKGDSQTYTSFKSSYQPITSVTLPDWPHTAYDVASMSSSSLDLKDSDVVLINRELEALRQIRQTGSYESLQELIMTPSSQLHKLVTFALCYVSLKVKVVERLIMDKDYNFNTETSSLRKSSSQSVTVQAPTKASGNWVYRYSRNYVLLGKYRHSALVKQFVRPFEIFSSPVQVSFWKLSHVCDALGRLMRVVPNQRGLRYLDHSSSKYSKLRSQINTDPIPVKPSFVSHSSIFLTASFSESTGGLVSRPNRTPYLIKTKRQMVLECERVTLSYTVFGDFELYPDMLIWRSKGKARPNTERYQYGALNSTMKRVSEFKVWTKAEVEEVLEKTFMHQSTALELYVSSGRSYFFNFYDRETLEAFYCQLEAWKYKAVFGGQNAVEGALRRWKSGQMSNLEYLMELNKHSGRSLHSLSQYYVFPWVVTDYDRPHLDDPDSPNPRDMRDLSLPVGCLNEEKRREAEERYEMFSGEEGLQPYHYGSHYSSGGIALYYLLRLEPFTYQSICFQDNHFDVPDRIFSSLKLAWNSSYRNSGDHKELVPQFFYQAAFLLNLNQYDLGTRKSDGFQVSDVQLPTWALQRLPTQEDYQQDVFAAHRFVFMHSQVLESQYVSSSLHEWVNLIFGAYQRSAEKVNVFFPLTYACYFEEHIRAIKEFNCPVESMMTQIAYFGQTPTQIFAKPHEPRAKLPKKDLLSQDFLMLPEPTAKTSLVTQAHEFTVRKLMLAESQSCLVYKLISSGRYFVFFFDAAKTDPSRLYDNITSARFSAELDNIAELAEPLDSSDFVMLSEKFLVVSRFSDMTFKFFRVTLNPVKLELKLIVAHHLGVVNCLAGVKDTCLVTGCVDGSMALWDVTETCVFKSQLRGHDMGIRQIKVNQPCQLAVSLSGPSKILLHDLRSGSLFNEIETQGPVSSLDLSKMGLIAAASGTTVTFYSINGSLGRGTLLVQSLGGLVGEEAQILSTKFTAEGEFLLLSGTFASYVVSPVYSLKTVPKAFETYSPVAQLELDWEEKVLWVLPEAHQGTKVHRTSEVSEMLRRLSQPN
jgi:hypothetical protein